MRQHCRYDVPFLHSLSCSTTLSTNVTSLNLFAWFSRIFAGSPPFSARNNSISNTIIVQLSAYSTINVWMGYCSVGERSVFFISPGVVISHLLKRITDCDVSVECVAITFLPLIHRKIWFSIFSRNTCWLWFWH